MSNRMMAELAFLDSPYFSRRIFMWACAGAILTEWVRLHNLRRDADLRWSPSYPTVSVLLVLLGGVIAWILPTYTRTSAFYVGISTPILFSYFFKSRAPRRIVSRPKGEGARRSRGSKSVADQMIEHSRKLGAAPGSTNQSRYFEPPKAISFGAPPPSLPAERMALIAALKGRSNQRFEGGRFVDDQLDAGPFWKSIRTDFLNGI
jgi:hypothetical protein